MRVGWAREKRGLYEDLTQPCSPGALMLLRVWVVGAVQSSVAITNWKTVTSRNLVGASKSIPKFGFPYLFQNKSQKAFSHRTVRHDCCFQINSKSLPKLFLSLTSERETIFLSHRTLAVHERVNSRFLVHYWSHLVLLKQII
jgi:hypothetical protein